MPRSRGWLAAGITTLGLMSQAPVLLAQSAILSVGAGPTVFPGSGAGMDWHASVSVGVRTRGAVAPRLDLAYLGVPISDLVAITGNLVWSSRRREGSRFQPYLVAGVGPYVKFGETRIGLNGGAGVRYPAAGSHRLYLEARYHGMLKRFEEAADVRNFLLFSLGVSIGN
jgi:hypothetical protein